MYHWFIPWIMYIFVFNSRVSVQRFGLESDTELRNIFIDSSKTDMKGICLHDGKSSERDNSSEF